MRSAISLVALTVALSLGAVDAHAGQAPNAAADVLATVRIPQAALANGKPLPPGTYELRLTREQPAPLKGQSADAQRWVEFVAGGAVAGREVAEILRDSDLPAVGASSVPSGTGTRVDLLKGGDFLRVSVKRGGERYLVYLPVAP